MTSGTVRNTTLALMLALSTGQGCGDDPTPGDDPAPGPGNTAPVADAAAVSTVGTTPVDLLLIASDADGDALTFTLVQGPEHGSFTGTVPQVTYVADGGYVGPDALIVRVSDGTDSVDAALTVEVTVPALATVTAPGVLRLNVGPFASATGLPAGSIDESVFVDIDGSAVVVNSLGYQQRFENVARVVADAGDGKDEIELGGRGTVVGELRGGAGNDKLITRDGNDILDGEDGADLLEAGRGDDILRGGDGLDAVHAGPGDDRIELFLVTDFFDRDEMSGGTDKDTVALVATDELDDIEVTTLGGPSPLRNFMFVIRDQTGFAWGQTNFIVPETRDWEVVEVTLQGGDDEISIESDPAFGFVVTGGAGKDTIEGGAGPDILRGGANDDTIRGGAGIDEIHGDAGDDLLEGGSDFDVLYGGPGVNTFNPNGDLGDIREQD